MQCFIFIVGDWSMGYIIINIMAYIVIPFFAIRAINVGEKSKGLSLDACDTLKGLSILLIMIHHAAQKFMPAGFLKPYQDFGYLGVSIFIFLSGYGLTLSYLKNNKLNGFFRRRLSKVYTPFVVISLIYVVVYVITNHSYDLYEVIISILGVKLVNGSYWFVHYIIFAYVFYYFSLRFGHEKLGVWFVSFLTVIYWVACYNYALGKWWYTTSFCFPLGVYVAFHNEKIKSNIVDNIYLFVGFSVFLLAASTVAALTKILLLASIAKTISSLTFAFLVYVGATVVSINSPFLSRLGKFSYEVYLCHIFILSLFVDLNSAINAILFITCTWLLSFLMHKTLYFRSA